MDTSAPPPPLERSLSVQSAASIKSHRSATPSRHRRQRLTSQPSSSASSIAASDKSLTSFPSFSPESPREERPFTPDLYDGATLTSASRRKSPSLTTEPDPAKQQQQQQQLSQKTDEERSKRDRPASIVESLTSTPPQPQGSDGLRDALFEDSPPATRHAIPGALHHADDEHVERLIARHGAVNLVRQIAEDLARRDAQIASLRRRAEDRERALRKIILECGLSTLDLETRLRALEAEARENERSRRLSGMGAGEGVLSDMMNDAMANDVRYAFGAGEGHDSTIRASSATPRTDNGRGTARSWRNYLWGGGTVTKNSWSSIGNGDSMRASQTVIRAVHATERRPGLQENLFSPPPEAVLTRSSSRASSITSTPGGRKTSLASMALRLVAGGAATVRESEPRGRANSANLGGSLRASSISSVKTSASARVASASNDPKALMAMRRAVPGRSAPVNMPAPARSTGPERWDTSDASPSNNKGPSAESHGPVEMDTIFAPEEQPPTLTHIYNNYNAGEYLTDRFGFIYDQRRKKRQREAAQMARQMKKGSRHEMLTNGRSGLSPVTIDDSSSAKWEVSSDGRPGTPSSVEDPDKPKRWQDYLKIATFPTELLSHTPSITVPGFEVLEGGEVPISPGTISAEQRGFLPATTATTAVGSETLPISESEQASGTLVKEDAEPVKLLLKQLSDVHDSLQREKTVRWNDFLRKVRAERRRDGEAAAVAAAAAAEARFQKATVVMPETRIGDGELIGVASLGVQGKVGRAKANEFKALVLGGIPVAYRAKIWSECSGARALRVPGYYEDLVNRPEDQDDPQIVHQIKADITRTLTDNIFFRKGPGVAKLNEVLLAYSRRNPEVGYCQGMNLVTANLLLIMPSAEDAFWVLTSIIEHILPQGYFDHSLLASRADQQVLRGYVAEVLPRLSQHFDEMSIDLETMTFQWFLSVFTDCLSAEALFRVWDVVLCTSDGGTFLFQVALALLKLNEPQLLACSSPASVYTYINHQMTNHAISIDGLIQASEGLRRLVRKDDVEARRARAIDAEREQLRKREERNAARRSMQKAAATSTTVPPIEEVSTPESENGTQAQTRDASDIKGLMAEAAAEPVVAEEIGGEDTTNTS